MTKVSEEVLPPVGKHTGSITSVTAEERTYGDKKEPKYVVTIQATDGDYDYTPLEKVYSQVLSMNSGFGRLLQRCGVSMAPGADIDEQSIVGREVVFEVVQKPNGFLDIVSDSIAATE